MIEKNAEKLFFTITTIILFINLFIFEFLNTYAIWIKWNSL